MLRADRFTALLGVLMICTGPALVVAERLDVAIFRRELLVPMPVPAERVTLGAVRVWPLAVASKYEPVVASVMLLLAPRFTSILLTACRLVRLMVVKAPLVQFDPFTSKSDEARLPLTTSVLPLFRRNTLDCIAPFTVSEPPARVSEPLLVRLLSWVAPDGVS